MSYAETFIAKLLGEGMWRCAAGRNHYIEWSHEYATGQGYDQPAQGIAFADWNACTRWNDESKSFDTLCECMPRIARIAEAAGYDIEWSDGWSTCSGCSKAVRTQPDHHGWRAQFWLGDGELLCRECADPYVIARECVGESSKALPAWVTPESVGYHPVAVDFESGWHEGQNDDPAKVAERLRSANVKRFLFVVDDIGQFDVSWRVCVRKRDLRRATEALSGVGSGYITLAS